MPLPNLNRPCDLSGIAYICAGVFFLTISDSIAKGFAGQYSPIQLIFLRSIISLPAISVACLLTGKKTSLHTATPELHLFRGFISVISACSYYFGIMLLPFADVTAIGYSSPLFVAGISALFFKEKVNIKTWFAIFTGFLGVLVFARPGAQGIQIAAIFPLATALGYAIMMISAVKMDPYENILTSMLFLAVAQFIFSGIAAPWFWQPVEQKSWIAFAGLAIFSTLGLGLITQAFRIAPASIIAPYDYTSIIWAIIIGWLCWKEKPDVFSYCGVALISLSGIYIIAQKSRLGKTTQTLEYKAGSACTQSSRTYPTNERQL